MMSDAAQTRHYLHGDLREELPSAYYCARCDAFVDPEHFADPFHERTLAAKLAQSLGIWLGKASDPTSRFRRLDKAENFFPEALAKAASSLRREQAERLRLAAQADA